jgi:hypothetical protein
MKKMNKNKPILPILLSPPCPTVAIAIASAILILIIINQLPIPLFSPTPFVTHKFSAAHALNIKRKMYSHRYSSITVIKQTTINHCYCAFDLN